MGQMLDEARMPPAYSNTSLLAIRALVAELDAHAGIEERQLAQALGQDVVMELDIGEISVDWLETHRRAAAGRRPHHLERELRFAQVIFLLVLRGHRARWSSQSFSDSALTTETPTPCRPPETL
jgi:hypothetical protein